MSWPEGEPAKDPGFEPQFADIIEVKNLLLRAGLVADLLEDILDYAEYWVCSKAWMGVGARIPARATPGLSEEWHGNSFLLRSWPVGILPHRIEGPFSIQGGSAEMMPWLADPVDPAPLERECGRKYFEELARHPVTKLDHPARKIVFRIRSHDQGWTTHSTTGAFHDSCTWFDVGIDRFEDGHSCHECEILDKKLGILPRCKLKPIEPPPFKTPDGKWRYALRERFNKWEVQRNRVAQSEWTDYTVTWRRSDSIRRDSVEAEALFLKGENPGAYDGRFVSELRLGDVVTLWGRSVQAGWENFVSTVQIDVYWAMG